MTNIPHAVLSEQFEERMKGQRLVSAVFTTYRFDPAFFEQEILPVFLDVGLSQVVAIRLIQLEDMLRRLVGEIAVYYDRSGLEVGDSGTARLDIRRIPVRHRTGIFHPKNVFVLTESTTTEDGEPPERKLLVACLSANLTRAGWWENVEVCHIEEIQAGERTRLTEDLITFLDGLRRRPGLAANRDHQAIVEILRFLRGTEQRSQRSSEGRLLSHFYDGRESIPDFLDRAGGNALRGLYLEVISPYFDNAKTCRPLEELVNRFQPKETRVFLPRGATGEAACREHLYDAVTQISEVQWGSLPKDLVRSGRSEEATPRMVHAKVYRFFSQNPKREILFVGSVNLTNAAHQAGGNVETGFLVEVDCPQRPVFWLAAETKRPKEFQLRLEDETTSTSDLSRLAVQYHWGADTAKIYWDADKDAPPLRLESRGPVIAEVPKLPARIWRSLDAPVVKKLRDALQTSAFVTVQSPGMEPAFVLVQEEGMSHKPSLLLNLSVEDVLHYWALLTDDQRAAFVEGRATDLMLTKEGADLIVRNTMKIEQDTLFSRFAGFFHAFGCLERAVHAALDANNERDANYRLFGNKYDSLGYLLDKVLKDEEMHDPVARYVIVMCAKQLCRETEKKYPDYWRTSKRDVSVMVRRFEQADVIREALIKKAPLEMRAFLDWFDRWFLHRASVAEEVA